MTKGVLKRHYGKLTADLLAQYQRYLVVRYQSRATRNTYLSLAQHFAGFVSDPLTPSKTSIYTYFAVRCRQVAPATLNLELSALKRFYGWAFEYQYISIDIRPRFPLSRRVPARLPRWLSDEQISRLLAAPALDTPIGLRDHTIIRLLYETGLRASELAGLGTGDVLEADRLIFVRGKGAKERYLPISADLLALLQQWQRVRLQLCPGKNNSLFVSSRGHHLFGRQAVWRIVNKYCQAALGIGGGYNRLHGAAKRSAWSGVSPHVLRSSFATALLHNGCDIRAIQEFMGHENINTTARYLGVDVGYLKSQHNKLFKPKT